MRKLIAILFGPAIAIVGSGAAAAAEYAADFVFSWRSTGTVYSLEEAHIVWSGDLGGLARPGADATGPLAGLVMWLCPLYSDVGGAASGFCIGTDTEGDKVYMRSAGATAPMDQWVPGAIGLDTGTFVLYAGTGKFEGISGSLSFSGNSFGLLPDGTFVGYTEVQGTYQTPQPLPGEGKGMEIGPDYGRADRFSEVNVTSKNQQSGRDSSAPVNARQRLKEKDAEHAVERQDFLRRIDARDQASRTLEADIQGVFMRHDENAP